MASASIIEELTDKFQGHKHSQFTGVVHVGAYRKPQWSIYFHMGRMVWAHAHPDLNDGLSRDGWKDRVARHRVEAMIVVYDR